VNQEPPADYLQKVCEHCSEKQLAAKEAQSRCDRIFLSLYSQKHPIPNELGVVISVGTKAFTAFVPRLGCEAMLFLEEHSDILQWTTNAEDDGADRRKIFLHNKSTSANWKNLTIDVFTKLRVTIICKENAPIDVKLRFEGLWTDE